MKCFKRRKNIITLQHLIRNNNGSTMVETLVSFVVLVIILAILMRMVDYCYRLQMRAIDTDRVFSSFNEELYKPIDKIDTDEVTAREIKTDENLGPVFYLMLDTGNTKMLDNNVKDNATDYTNFKIGLYDIKGNSYSSVNSMIEDEKLVTPQALLFDYEE